MLAFAKARRPSSKSLRRQWLALAVAGVLALGATDSAIAQKDAHDLM